METSSRRKACDTCFKKKIRCDMLKPACSNCLLYKVSCSTTVLRRRTAPVPPKEADVMSSSVDDDSVGARLARIEAKLNRLGGSSPSMAIDQLPGSASIQAERSTPSSTVPCLGLLSSSGIVHLGDYNIPPLTEILPIVDDYFRDFNPALPLFHQIHFTQMLYEFYSQTEQTKKSRAAWAAINVVLAIGYRIRTIEAEDIMVRFDDRKVKRCIDNAQKELDELVTRDEDTLGIQVLLGLVILFQTNTDQKPASVLVGTAVRLAHRLQLHVKSTLSDYPPEVARHRSNLFWLSYCLDKDISMRSMVPSFQNDEDVDLDLPLTETGDDGNYLSSIDGRTQLNYLRIKVQLAYIQGQTYDCLLSNRSTKVSAEVREERVAHLSRLLNQWLQTIPAPLQIENIMETLDKAPLTHMVLLYHTYLLCSTTLNGLYSLKSPWVKSTSGFTAAALKNFVFEAHVCMRHQQPLLPHFWDSCVGASRGCLNILNAKTYSGCNLWLSGCAYFSAFIVLLANVVYFPLHELVSHDRKLTQDTMKRMEKLLEHTGPESFHKLHVVVMGLNQAADHAVERARTVSETREPSPLVTQPSYSLYPSHFEEFSNLGQNLVLEYTWPPVSALNGSGIDLDGFDFNDEALMPEFMRGLS
ncbi:hypothetical protein F4804DRAFT_322595 [Jackrogersella minutella]|nr:hypothetical protein F4804DRAFT_322595 [Jackrogersella minutella]